MTSRRAFVDVPSSLSRGVRYIEALHTAPDWAVGVIVHPVAVGGTVVLVALTMASAMGVGVGVAEVREVAR
jgi:hypothetical protein